MALLMKLSLTWQSRFVISCRHLYLSERPSSEPIHAGEPQQRHGVHYDLIVSVKERVILKVVALLGLDGSPLKVSGIRISRCTIAACGA